MSFDKDDQLERDGAYPDWDPPELNLPKPLPKRIPPTKNQIEIYKEIRKANKLAFGLEQVIPVAATWDESVHYDSRKSNGSSS